MEATVYSASSHVHVANYLQNFQKSKPGRSVYLKKAGALPLIWEKKWVGIFHLFWKD